MFVNSMSDLFHDHVPDGFIARVWAVMAATLMRRVGKTAAGRELDGRTWDEFPETEKHHAV